MDCQNIMQIVVKIKKSKKFHKQAFFILTASIALIIPKIMILINNFNKKIKLAIYLQNLFPTYIKSDKKGLIRTFILILKLDIKAKYLKNFHNSNTRIWICTSANNIILNIKNIVCIIQ